MALCRESTKGTIMAEYLKYDDNKNRLELIDPDFILGVGKVLTFGAEKYADDNWKNATWEDRKKSMGSLLRHTMAYRQGEEFDKESGIEHLYHMATNIMFMAWYDKNLKQPSEDHPGQTYMEGLYNGDR